MKHLTTLMLAGLLSIAGVQAETIYLNNGKVINGAITKDDGYNVEVSANGNTYTYKKTEIRRIDQASNAAVVPATPKRAAYKDYESQQKGWWCALELTAGASEDLDYNPHFYNAELSFVNGYRFNQFIAIGIGLGYRYYIPSEKEEYRKYDGHNGLYEIKNQHYEQTKNGVTYNGTPWSIPLFFNMRGNLVSNDTRRCVPYWSLDLGYTFSALYLNGSKWDGVSYGGLNNQIPSVDNSQATVQRGDGFFYAPTLGLKIGGPRNCFLLGFTYMGQILPRYAGYGNNIYSTTRLTHFVCGKIAYEF